MPSRNLHLEVVFCPKAQKVCAVEALEEAILSKDMDGKTLIPNPNLKLKACSSGQSWD